MSEKLIMKLNKGLELLAEKYAELDMDEKVLASVYKRLMDMRLWMLGSEYKSKGLPDWQQLELSRIIFSWDEDQSEELKYRYEPVFFDELDELCDMVEYDLNWIRAKQEGLLEVKEKFKQSYFF